MSGKFRKLIANLDRERERETVEVGVRTAVAEVLKDDMIRESCSPALLLDFNVERQSRSG